MLLRTICGRYLSVRLTKETANIVKLAKFCTEVEVEKAKHEHYHVGNHFETLKVEPDFFEQTKLTVDDFKELITDDDDRKYVEEVLEYHEMLRYTRDDVCSTISARNMLDLLILKRNGQKTQARKYFNYMYNCERRKILAREEREQRQQELVKFKESRFVYPEGQLFDEHNQPIYGSLHNSTFMYMREKRLRYPQEQAKRRAAMFGSKLVFDFSFESLMNRRDVRNTIKHVSSCYGFNSRHHDPFDLYFCNLNRKSLYGECVQTAMGDVDDPSFLVTATDKCYMDLFPREQLVYMTPDAEEAIDEFDDDKVYIIGAFVDRCRRVPMASYSKAVSKNIATRKLPLDEMAFDLAWAFGSRKALRMVDVLHIMLHVKSNHNQWRQAMLEYLPSTEVRHDLKELNSDYDCNLASEVLADKYQQFKLN